MLLTDDLLLNYKRCRRRPFLDIHGDFSQKEPKRDFVFKLQQQSKNHIANVLEGKTYQQPDAPYKDWQALANQTTLLMKLGVEYINRGVLLLSEFPDWGLKNYLNLRQVTLVGFPSLLVKQPGKSRFGDWYYIPTNIKLGRKAKPEYKLVSAFHAQLLSSIQGRLPENGQVILKEKNIALINLGIWLPKLKSTLEECLEMLQLYQEPEVFISRQRCSLCHWYSYCHQVAEKTAHLSLVPGVTPNRYEYLQTIGITTPEALANIAPEQIEEPWGWEIASSLQQQAQAIWENRAIVKQIDLLGDNLTIPTASIELYFDIEAEPERNVDYLFGVLLVDRLNNTEKFYPFIAEKVTDEGLIWQQFLELVQLHPQAPIFHFSEYEVDAVERVANLYNTPKTVIQPLLSRFVDLHNFVTKSVILPVESYSLKSIANWLGFQWRDRQARGDQSVCWYDWWLQSKDRSWLDTILRYNEDDCRATMHLKNWLVDFL